MFRFQVLLINNKQQQSSDLLSPVGLSGGSEVINTNKTQINDSKQLYNDDEFKGHRSLNQNRLNIKEKFYLQTNTL